MGIKQQTMARDKERPGEGDLVSIALPPGMIIISG
jgi:hypothetical protein